MTIRHPQSDMLYLGQNVRLLDGNRSVSLLYVLLPRCILNHTSRLAVYRLRFGKQYSNLFIRMCRSFYTRPINDRVSVSHVCAYFRCIAYSTPKLWTTLNLPEFKFRTLQTMLSFRDHFMMILRSSAPHALTFSINVIDSSNPTNRLLALRCFKTLCEQCARWRAVYIDTYALSIIPRYVPSGTLPLLEHIGVIGSSPPVGYAHPSIFLLQTAPRLTSVECHDFGSRSEGLLNPSLLDLPHVSHYSAGGSSESFNIVCLHIRVLNFAHLFSLDL